LLLNNNKTNTFNFDGSSAEDVVTQAMYAIAPFLPNTVKLTTNQPNKLILRITNVKGLNQYNDVVQYLTSFNQISQTNLIKISPSEIELSITITGDQQNLLTTLNAQNRLVRNTNIATIPPNIDLDFKWVPVNNEQPQTTSTQPLPQG
jgi:hypothetical protein